MKDIFLGNVPTLLFSFVYVLLSLIIWKVLERFCDKFSARKVLHMLVGNAVILPIILGADLWAAALPSFIFIIVTGEMVKRNIFERGFNDSGLVLYPFSILLLTWNNPDIVLYFQLNIIKIDRFPDTTESEIGNDINVLCRSV